jgi:hypothetical protein
MYVCGVSRVSDSVSCKALLVTYARYTLDVTV